MNNNTNSENNENINENPVNNGEYNLQDESQETKVLDNISSTFNKVIQKVSFVVDAILSIKKFMVLRKLESKANAVMKLRSKMIELTDEELKEKTNEFRKRLETCKLDDIMIEAFAVAREVSRRILGEEHYKVQIMGGIALHNGMIAEMKTGEGKTLVGVLPTYLNALTGKGVHVVTVNDYLAKRDAEWMGRIHEFLGLTVGCSLSNMNPYERKKQYAKDIVYVTASQLGFDYLHDNLAKSFDDICQSKGLEYCIVDEVDSVLIDEARVPLIISDSVKEEDKEQDLSLYVAADKIVKMLNQNHYEINLKENKANFTDEGVDKVEELAREFSLIGEEDQLYIPQYANLLHHLAQCLRANHLYKLGIEYIVDRKTKEIKIVDEHTGRILHGRRYSHGLHQALEAKEGLEVRPETEIQASITFQKLFKLYKKLSGMTGTAITEAEEFEKTYNLYCIPIPTNNRIKRVDHEASLYGRVVDKMEAITDLVKKCYQKGQPVIVGTVNVQSSEEIGKYLTDAGIPIKILNAKNHEEEADIIANAGRFGMVTVVTNMSGRGTDIKLGGDAKVLVKQKLGNMINLTDEEKQKITDEIKLDIKLNREKVINAGGLFVIGVEHNPNRRIDNQLRGRSGRQGDVGESKFFAAMQDELPKKFLRDPKIMEYLFEKGEDLTSRFSTKLLDYWQTLDEGRNFDSRQDLQRYADIKEFYMENFYDERQNVLYKTPLMNWLNGFAVKFIKTNASSLFKELNDVTQVRNKADYIENLFFEKINEMFKIYEGYTEQYLRGKILYHLDLMWQKYLTTMEHERYAVILYQYANKDPVIMYQKKAEIEFKKLNHIAHFNIIIDILTCKLSQEHDFSTFSSPFNPNDNNPQFNLDEITKKFEELKNKLAENQNNISIEKNDSSEKADIKLDNYKELIKNEMDSIFKKYDVDPLKIFDQNDQVDDEYMNKFRQADQEIKENAKIKEWRRLEEENTNKIFDPEQMKEHLEKAKEMFDKMDIDPSKISEMISPDVMEKAMEKFKKIQEELDQNPELLNDIKEKMSNPEQMKEHLEKAKEMFDKMDIDPSKISEMISPDVMEKAMENLKKFNPSDLQKLQEAAEKIKNLGKKKTKDN